MKKFGPFLGALVLLGIIAALTITPASCQLSPEQQRRLQAITVPATAIGLGYAQREGLIEQGDRITLTKGVAILVSDQDVEAKLFKLGELGLQQAMDRGLIQDGNVVEVTGPDTVTISVPEPAPELTSGKSPTQSPLPPPGS